MNNNCDISDEVKETALKEVNKIIKSSVENIIANIKVTTSSRLTPIQEDDEGELNEIHLEIVSERSWYCCPSCLW